MDKYVISADEEVLDAEPPFPESLKADVKVMELHKHTKLGNIIDYVNKFFEEDANRRIIFRGLGRAADKCVSCVEVYKRKRQVIGRNLPVDSPQLKVTIDTPAIFIMLSRDPYPVEFQCMSMQQSPFENMVMSSKNAPSSSTKRGGNRRQQQHGVRTNKWVRTPKGTKDAETVENEAILEKLQKLS
ncbi:Alba domain-containing protein [Trichostrongylus colubriformis]|uniref:Alba domain-containing protein n=1 Tax=Trichostrongylus colubriformis TaxID=6319 RepID=A0AAN8FCD8_TRICO